MTNKKGPALYELISTKQTAEPQTHEPPQDDFVHDINLEHNVLAPGRSVRMSVGTIGVVVAVGIALIVISYTLGFRRGSSITQEDYRSGLSNNGTQNSQAELVEPRKLQDAKKNQKISTPTPSQWGPIMSDPRVSGFNYYTLIQTSKEGALQLVAFCREKGLETYAISGNNTRLYRVIALPGSVDSSDATATNVRSQINAIGREWTKTNEGRGSDLKDAYQSLYR
jgi:hypothetical protein